MGTGIDGIRAIARRAAGRVRAGRAGDERPPAGVHVQLRGPQSEATLRPSASPSPRALIQAGCLADIPNGGTMPVPDGAQVTPLAREEAFARGIRLVRASTVGDIRRAANSVRRVVVASDHGGLALKEQVLAMLADLACNAVDLGTRDGKPCDYPDLAAAVAREVAAGRADVGIVIDGAGIGSAMAAGKIPGVLAANCWNAASARNAREHNHANVLTLGAGHLDRARTYEILEAFLSTPVGEGRHARRVDKIHALAPRPCATPEEAP